MLVFMVWAKGFRIIMAPHARNEVDIRTMRGLTGAGRRGMDWTSGREALGGMTMASTAHVTVHMDDASEVELHTQDQVVCLTLIQYEAHVFINRTSLLVMRDLITEYLERKPV